MARRSSSRPDALHLRLRNYAQKHHRTMSDIALAAIEREMARYDWHDQLSQRPATDLGVVSAASLLEQDGGAPSEKRHLAMTRVLERRRTLPQQSIYMIV